MKIGVLTYYKVANFGANLQALSTYQYLKAHGHQPIFIYFESEKTSRTIDKSNDQVKEHLNFVDSNIKEQTNLCLNASDVNEAIKDYGIEALLIGSDAILQHHPLISRIHLGRRKPFYIEKFQPERLYPNLFWGNGLTGDIPKALMSVSSQNSPYKLFSKGVKNSMKKDLDRMVYKSVRDIWTLDMVKSIGENSVNLTPDPVFGFNYNLSSIIPNKKEILKKFNLKESYVLVSLQGQNLSVKQLDTLKDNFHKENIETVALPLPKGVRFKHNFEKSIQLPLSPIDWYALIKYSSGYIGCNMHPIVVSLHNAVPCFSIDAWGLKNFRGKITNPESSKVYDIMKQFGVEMNHTFIDNGLCKINVELIIDGIINFPKERVSKYAKEMESRYLSMMKSILSEFNKAI